MISKIISAFFLTIVLLSFTHQVSAQTNAVPDDVELAVLKKVYDSLGGSGWTSKTGWPAPGAWPASATSTQFGTWKGIAVSNGDISAIVLNGNNLVGKLPRDISKLTKLTSLRVQTNSISGKIPAWLGKLVNLKMLYLYSNQLTGTLPDSLAFMTSMEDLQLSANQLSGSIPSSLGTLPHLITLYLTSNHFTGQIPSSLGQLSTLQNLRLNDNQLTGSIPASLGNLSALINLYLDTNQLSGSLPAKLGNLSNLAYLSVNNNQLTGTIPAHFGKLTKLKSLYLLNNQLEGQLPDSLGYMSALQVLYVSDNSLSGSIPASFGNLTELTYFYVFDNMFSGSLPTELGNCTKIKYFNVSNNDFTGPIPAGCGNWNDLVSWSCYSNHFTGTLPATLFSNRTSLSGISVSNNAFEGAFPSIAGCTSLTNLSAASNSFTTLPAGVLGAGALTLLNFATNEVTTLPDFSTQQNRTKLALWVSYNRIDPSTLEPAKNAGLKSVSLTPQNNFKDVTSVDPHEGDPLVIAGRPAGTGTLAWEKLQSDGVTWVNVDTQNQDPNPVKLTFRRNAYAKATDEGTYRFSITGTQFSGTTFRSEPIRVQEQLTIVLDDWAFQYRYDGRRRMTHKKVPGAGWVYMVYDDRDRLVLTQDAEQRNNNKWLFTKYDALNRPVMTGIYTHPTPLTQEDMSGQISTTNFYETYSTTGSPVYHGYSNNVFPTGSLANSSLEILTVTYYDNYDFQPGWGNEYGYAAGQVANQPVNDQTYEQPADKFSSVIGQVTGTKVRTLETEPCWLQTVTYYDDHYRPVQVISDNYKKGIDRITNVYDFVGKVLATKTDHIVGNITWVNQMNVTVTTDKLTKSTTGSAWSTSGASSSEQIPANTDGWVECTVAEVNTQRVFGLSEGYTNRDLTSVKYGFLQNSTLLYVRANGTQYTVSSGAAAGDRLRVARENGVINFYKNGIKIPTGTVTYTNTLALIADASIYTSGGTISRARISAAQGQQQIVARHMVYDHAGRLKETWHKLNGGQDILLAKNDYNELGQLVDKKLHSTVSDGTNAKQSVDYRYNIRGWLTSINNAALVADATNDDANDLFGMNLAYNTADLGIATTQQFNGNISAISYSKDWGKGDIKQTGYGFAYDPMNRLTNASHQQRATQAGAWTSGGFDEGNITYDLNGNIKTLQRKGKDGVLIDNLSYQYESSDITASNKLLWVEDQATDAANKAKGFSDGNSGAKQDYTYDTNGNMTRDLNKGIGTSTTDAVNVIAYNHLNLPQTVSKGGSTIRYVYDATGRKLAQCVTSGASVKRTDYAGEFIYEDNVLQFLNHEEGRIVVASPKLIYTNSFDEVNTDEMTAINASLANYTSKGEKYVTATAANTSPGNGVFPIGLPVDIGTNERYRIRVKAYAVGSPAYLQAQTLSGATVTTSTAAIPSSAVSESWIDLVVTTPASGTNMKLQVGVVWNTVVAGEHIYLNEIEIIKLETTAPEYQYHLKDHLGNVRLTFTTKEEVETNKATMEAESADVENDQFVRYDEVRKVRSALFDHTNNTNPTSTDGQSIRLSGNANEKTGLVKTLSVMPGDVVHMKVYAKYVDQNNTNWSTALNNLVAAIAGAQSGTVIDGSNYTTNGATPFPYTGVNGTNSSTGLGPKAYLNYIMFDRDYTPVIEDHSQTGFVRVTDVAKENGQTNMADLVNGVPHELLEATVTVKQAGYLYIYLSNEESSPVEVFFDDFEVVHAKGPVVQSEEYYPFGLTFNGYGRENSVANRWKFQGQEHVDDLSLGWDSFKWRNHQPDIGRFFNVDPLAEEYDYNSPYAFSENKVVSHKELEGLEAVEAITPAAGAIVVGEELVAAAVVVAEFAPPLAIAGGLIYLSTKLDDINAGGMMYSSPAVSTAMSLSKPGELSSAKPLNSTDQNQTPTQKRSASDQKLIDQANAQKAKENAAKERAQGRQQQTQQGKQKVGQSNQQVRGDHNSGSQSNAKKQKHENALPRRLREQAKADKKKEESKKKK